MDDKDAPNFKHGMYEGTENFSRMEKLHIYSQAEDYIEQLGGEESLTQSEMFDCYYLASIEFRIVRAENIMWDNLDEYIEDSNPESNLERMMNRRQDMRKDLGLLSESPEQKQADSAGDFFDALSDE